MKNYLAACLSQPKFFIHHSSFCIYLVYCSISGSASELSTSSHSIGFTFSCRYWKATNRAGTMNICNIIPINIPPMAEVPNVRLPLAPAPEANISGSKPTIIARDVIRIGRKRAAAPSTAAHVIPAAVEGKLYNQNGVLGQQTHQHDEGNLHVDVIGHGTQNHFQCRYVA